MLRVRVPHHILNAKQHEREAEIKPAGRLKVTISTNMAAAAPNILLSGNPNFRPSAWAGRRHGAACKGSGRGADLRKERKKYARRVRILGTERHESRRIDSRLRAGRTGDRSSLTCRWKTRSAHIRFRQDLTAREAGMTEDMPIEHPLITKAIENAQTRVGHNFEIESIFLNMTT
jgi:preprotein translocase subunit SecA